ncbi:MAG: hypothetical protein IKX86_07300 [Clostridia bacterium]|nr:hypothetical protein [Clostridia bacterium]
MKDKIISIISIIVAAASIVVSVVTSVSLNKKIDYLQAGYESADSAEGTKKPAGNNDKDKQGVNGTSVNPSQNELILPEPIGKLTIVLGKDCYALVCDADSWLDWIGWDTDEIRAKRAEEKARCEYAGEDYNESLYINFSAGYSLNSQNNSIEMSRKGFNYYGGFNFMNDGRNYVIFRYDSSYKYNLLFETDYGGICMVDCAELHYHNDEITYYSEVDTQTRYANIGRLNEVLSSAKIFEIEVIDQTQTGSEYDEIFNANRSNWW